jgi:hypothetical protein
MTDEQIAKRVETMPLEKLQEHLKLVQARELLLDKELQSARREIELVQRAVTLKKARVQA